ncbi:MAG: hypothetical protein ACRBI6_20615 [Acidimicrobiales bacterium]
MRAARTTASITFLVLALILASCSTSTPSANDPTDESPSGEGALDETSEPDPTTEFADTGELPIALSEVELVGSTALYLGIVDDQLVAVGVDAGSGHQIFRIAAHPLGRLRGVTPHLAIHPDSGQFFVTSVTTDDAGASAVLSAHSITTGELRWESATTFDAEQPFVCGDAHVCVRSDQDQTVVSIHDGSIERYVDATNRRVVASTDDGFIATVGPDTTPTDNLDFLAGSSDFGLTEAWRVSGSEILELTGEAITPMAGWAATHDLTSSATALFLGPAGPTATGAIVGFDRSTGELLWGRSDVHMCAFDEAEVGALLVCPANGSSGFTTREVSRLDPANGDELWTVDLGADVDPYSLEIVVSLEEFAVWADAEPVRLFDLATGAALQLDDVTWCTVGGQWHLVDWPWADQGATYRAVGHRSLCDLDGTPLEGPALGEALERMGGSGVAFTPDGRPAFGD